MQRLLANEPGDLATGLFDALTDTQPAAEEDLPHTGVSLEWEQQLATIFIRAPGYGTRASTVVLVGGSGELTLMERNSRPTAVRRGPHLQRRSGIRCAGYLTLV